MTLPKPIPPAARVIASAILLGMALATASSIGIDGIPSSCPPRSNQAICADDYLTLEEAMKALQPTGGIIYFSSRMYR